MTAFRIFFSTPDNMHCVMEATKNDGWFKYAVYNSYTMAGVCFLGAFVADDVMLPQHGGNLESANATKAYLISRGNTFSSMLYYDESDNTIKTAN
jgi:hypothetical protein